MKNIITLIGLLIGGMAFAQPTSGDPIMPDPTDGDTTLVVAVSTEQTKRTLEASITYAFKNGDAKVIATYFGENIDISILEKTNLYSKSQGAQVLQHFFSEHKPAKFSILHKGGGKKTAKYFIGELVDTDGVKYRVTVNAKPEGDRTDAIVLLSIEKS